MRTIKIIDKKNYNENWDTYYRDAVRAIIIKNNLVAMVKSKKDGYYKFPGGGMKYGETHADTLIRETAEETGLRVIPDSIKECGKIFEKRKSIYKYKEIFIHKSYYYYADVFDDVTDTNLEKYEHEQGFFLDWVSIEKAYSVNSIAQSHSGSLFLQRETCVLHFLMME